MTKAELGAEQLANAYAKGDRWARRDLFGIASKLGIDVMQNEVIAEVLAPDHQAIVDGFLGRHQAAAGTPAQPREFAPPELRDDDVGADAKPSTQTSVPKAPPTGPPKTAVLAAPVNRPTPAAAPAAKGPNTEFKTEAEFYEFTLQINKPRER